MDDRCTTMPSPVVRRIALGRLGFHWDRMVGAYRRDAEIIDEEALDMMDEDTFHRSLHTWAGEEACMANHVVASMSFGYGPAAPGVTRIVERGEVFALEGHAGDQRLLALGYCRPLADTAQVVRCEVCGTPFVEGLPEHMSKRHGPQEAA
jgi:hypothetical protein